jgi:hypothetical protein
VAIFSTYEAAEKWMEKKLEPYMAKGAPFTVEEMNYEIYEQVVDKPETIQLM